MLKEISLSEIVGKEVKGYDMSIANRQMVITFTDTTFTTLSVESGYEPGEEEIVGSSLDLYNFGDKKLIALGITTQKELTAARGKRRKEFILIKKNQDRQTYERLKAEFGD